MRTSLLIKKKRIISETELWLYTPRRTTTKPNLQELQAKELGAQF